MLMKNDVTDINPNEILHQMANELLMWDPDVKVVVEKTKKDNCNGECDSCECQDSDVKVVENGGGSGSYDESNPTENGILSKLESISIDEWEHGNGIEW